MHLASMLIADFRQAEDIPVASYVQEHTIVPVVIPNFLHSAAFLKFRPSF